MGGLAEAGLVVSRHDFYYLVLQKLSKTSADFVNLSFLRMWLLEWAPYP